jgi:hypothetical protein
MTGVPNQHGWSAEALFAKALLFVGEMERYAPDDWQHRLWASLSLELVARAALANISPVLLADRQNWRNIHHALGYQPTAKRFAPVSIRVTEVLDMLQELLVPAFTKELRDACVEQCGHRNAELHTGEDASTGMGTSAWLPKYYASCQVFLQSMGKKLDELFADPKLAEGLIASLQDMAAKSVGKDIQAHKRRWEEKSEEEHATSTQQATIWASRHVGHRAVCPACGSPALLRGSGQGSVATDIGQDQVVQKQTMLPSAFECLACGLKIDGLSKLSACGLGDAFIATTTLSPAEYFGLYTEQDLDEARASGGEPEWEEEFNEF